MQQLKYLFTFAAIAAVMAVPAPACAVDVKIGLVVTQNLLAGSDAGLAAFEKLKAQKEQAQEKLDKRASELQEMEADLKKRALVLSDDEKKAAAKEFDERQREATRLKEDLERNLKRQESEAMAEVNQFLSRIIVDFGDEEGYDLVLDAQAAVFFSEVMDITNQVVERANAEWGK